MSEITFKSADIPQQIAVTKIIVENYPKYSAAYIRLADSFEAKGMYPAAVKIYLALQEQIPDDFSIYISLARLYDRMGSRVESKKAMRKAAQLNPRLKQNAQVRDMLK
jgi:tetratricopeptide (TPR) repeat protein